MASFADFIKFKTAPNTGEEFAADNLVSDVRALANEYSPNVRMAEFLIDGMTDKVEVTLPPHKRESLVNTILTATNLSSAIDFVKDAINQTGLTDVNDAHIVSTNGAYSSVENVGYVKSGSTRNDEFGVPYFVPDSRSVNTVGGPEGAESKSRKDPSIEKPSEFLLKDVSHPSGIGPFKFNWLNRNRDEELDTGINNDDKYGAGWKGVELTSPEEIFNYFPFQGYSSLKGLSLDSNHLWDIKITPFTTNYWTEELVNNRWALTESNRKTPYGQGTHPYAFAEGSSNVGNSIAPATAFTPSLPTVKLSGREFDYNEWMPIVSYSYMEGSLESRELPLFGGSQIIVPNYFTKTGDFTIQVLEDDHKSIDNWMTSYSNAVYDGQTHAVADYKDVCYVIDLMMTRMDKRLNYHSQLLAVPIQWSKVYEGSGGPESNVVSISFKIVGHLGESPLAERTVDMKLSSMSVTLDSSSSVNLGNGTV